MSIEKIVCKQCSAPISWDGVSTRLQCSFCGTVYERSIRKEARQRYINEEGSEFLTGYYPPMFHGSYQIRNEGNELKIGCREMPVKVYYK